ncbi:MAG: glycosyltransferase family 2 protein [Chloroflexi bacterium]|nr:glycosyltransferase family 2 protein [Chloroflexota bacterium]
MSFQNAMQDGRFSVIIPNWNGQHYLQVCLDALRNQSYPDIEVIIADNASEDGSQTFIREWYPEVVLVELPENRGFTGACNAGMEVATGEYIALLNNDTEVKPDWVQNVIDALKRYPEASFAASKMLLFDQRDTFHTAGDFFRVDGMPGNRGVWEKDMGQYDEEEFVFSACGGSSVYRRDMLEDVGFLDDDFYFSCEDIDLSWRAQLQGYRCLYVPSAIVYHQLSATGGGVTASYYNGRNYIYLLVKDYPTDLWRQYWFAILRTQFRLAWDALKAWRGAAARARLRGTLRGLLDIPKLLRKRQRVQSQRRVSKAYLESILTPLDSTKT